MYSVSYFLINAPAILLIVDDFLFRYTLYEQILDFIINFANIYSMYNWSSFVTILKNAYLLLSQRHKIPVPVLRMNCW